MVFNEILKKLEKFEEKNKFTEKGLTLNKLAKNFNTNSTYLSLVISENRNLNFNKYLFGDSDKILEEVAYTIAYSVFDNYDVNVVFFEVNNKEVKQISINDIPKK